MISPCFRVQILQLSSLSPLVLMPSSAWEVSSSLNILFLQSHPHSLRKHRGVPLFYPTWNSPLPRATFAKGPLQFPLLYSSALCGFCASEANVFFPSWHGTELTPSRNRPTLEIAP